MASYPEGFWPHQISDILASSMPESAMPPKLKHAEFRGRIGTARITVTPPVGIYSRTWGSAKHDVAEGVHRPAVASCLVFQSGDSELVFITMDSCCADDGEVAAIRAAILGRFGLKPEQLMLHPSHSAGHRDGVGRDPRDALRTCRLCVGNSHTAAPCAPCLANDHSGLSLSLKCCVNQARSALPDEGAASQ
jgi:hypothetical protein